MDTMPVKLELTVHEINRVVLILAEKPYAQVADLIAKIRTQGNIVVDKAMEKALAPDKLPAADKSGKDTTARADGTSKKSVPVDVPLATAAQ